MLRVPALLLAFGLSLPVAANAWAQATPEQLDEIAKLSAAQFDAQKETFVESCEWLKDAKHTIANDKLAKDDVVKLVDELYAAGALRVYFTAVIPEGDGKKAPAMMVLVGGQPSVRTKVFDGVNAFAKKIVAAENKPELEESLKQQDAGQPVITLPFML